MGLHEAKNLCTVKETNNMTREPSVWENMFANKTSDKELNSKIYKVLIHSKPRRQTIQLKMGKGPEQTLLQRGHTDGQQAYEKNLNIANHQKDAN